MKKVKAIIKYLATHHLELIILFIAIVTLLYVMNEYTATHIPHFEFIESQKSENGERRIVYINPLEHVLCEYATFENIVIEIKGGKEKDIELQIYRDFTFNEKEIKNLKEFDDVLKDIQDGKNQKLSGTKILQQPPGRKDNYVNLEELEVMKGDFVKVNEYDSENLHYLVEFNLVFKTDKPLLIILRNNSDNPSIFRISYRLTFHYYKLSWLLPFI